MQKLDTEEIRLSQILAFWIRISSIILFFLAALFGEYFGIIELPLWVFLLVPGYVVVYFLIYYLRRSAAHERSQDYLFIDIFLDTLGITVIIYLTGGINSPFLLIYIVQIAVLALLAYPSDVIVAGVLQLVMISGLVIGQQTGLLSINKLTQYYGRGLTLSILHLLLIYIFILITAFLMFNIVSRLRRREEDLNKSNKELLSKMADVTYYRNYLENLIDNARAIIMVVDRRGHVKLINKYAETISGFSKEAVIGKSALKMFVSEERREELFDQFTKMFRGDDITDIEGDLLTKDGPKRRVMFRIMPVTTADGLVDQALLIGEDITEVKSLEQKLFLSSKMAAVGQVAASIAHELNNPLTIILSQLQLLQDSFKDEQEKYHKRVSRALSATERIRSLTENLMSFARPSRERRVAIDVNQLIEGVLSFSEYEIRRGQVDVARNFEENIPPVYGVKTQLEQMILNLLTNSHYAVSRKTSDSREGSGGRVVISTKGIDGRFVEITVSDNGDGIRDKNMHRIFEPFFSTRSDKTGIGLGLTIVKKVIDHHKGKISVESSPGGGASFKVLLPAGGEEGKMPKMPKVS